MIRTPPSYVLGINARNIDYISVYNKKKDFPLVDNKLTTKRILQKAGLPCPKLYHSYQWFWELQQLPEHLSKLCNFVMKPARGLAGGGILVLQEQAPDNWQTPSGKSYSTKRLVAHGSDILYGVHSIDNTTDTVLIEQKLNQHQFFNNLNPDGISDIRVIVLDHTPMMAMCRIPTEESDGKANISLGAIGAGINMDTGEIIHAVTKKGSIDYHPDSKECLIGRHIPFWQEIMAMSRRIQDYFPLGYLGVDIVLDKDQGPLILELNARPGLEIQNANREGLKRRIERHFTEASLWVDL
ncbi:MAG: alpha-L-glutamate ligase-like protein [Fibrobacteria bacterium]|nr:alpha-L-glutamate ligase-like protein [Fibrobacteria bacterium]